jgi:DUF4097 and DUF4098 domain-containing protein YvlB
MTAATALAAEREFKQTFPVIPGCTLLVDSYRGSITVVEGETLEVQVALHMEIGADNEAEADRLREALQLETKLEDNVVTLRARNPRETRVRFVWNDKNQMELAWRITVPKTCHIDVTTRQGSVSVGNFTGAVKARVEKGPIALKYIDGPVDAAVKFGDVVIARCGGPAKVRVLQGLIRVGTMLGSCDFKNSSGDVEVLVAHAGITASAEAGDVSVGFAQDMAGAALISTSGGGIRAKVDPDISASIDASAVWGSVESQVPMEFTSGASGKRALAGKINVGIGAPKAAITLRANGGAVRIVPFQTPFEENEGLKPK